MVRNIIDLDRVGMVYKTLSGPVEALREISLQVAEGRPSDPAAVFFGATVELEDADSGDVHRYRLVGPDETDAKAGFISIDSPLARALLRRRVDDEVAVELPGGARTYVILSVDYEAVDGGS